MVSKMFLFKNNRQIIYCAGSNLHAQQKHCLIRAMIHVCRLNFTCVRMSNGTNRINFITSYSLETVQQTNHGSLKTYGFQQVMIMK